MNLLDKSVDNSLDAFNDLLLACLDDHAPIKTVKIRHKPNSFITEDIRDLMRVGDRLHKRASKTGMREDWEVFKELRNRVKFVLRKAEREHYNQQICENKNNSGAMWKTIRSALPHKSGRPSLTKDTDTFANELNRFFISVGQKAADDSAELARLHDLPTTPVYHGSTHCEELFDFKAITSEDVRKVIMAMPCNKAPGYDRIPVFVIKDCLSYILPALTALINSSFSNSVFPKAWKKSEVVPHLKDGDHETPSNNRPISLLPVLFKVTEKIALNQFTEYLTQDGKLTCHQSGNRKFHSTKTLSLLVTGHIYKAMDIKEITALVLIDFSKAFDSICHRTLLSKLKGLGASNEALNWFERYLTNRTQSTRLGTSRSIELTVTHAVQ